MVLPNDYVFVMVGGVLPTKFLQNVGIRIQKHYGKRIEDDDGAGGKRGERGGKDATKAEKVPPPAREAPSDKPPREAPKPAPTSLTPALTFIESGRGGGEDPTLMLRESRTNARSRSKTRRPMVIRWSRRPPPLRRDRRWAWRCSTPTPCPRPRSTSCRTSSSRLRPATWGIPDRPAGEARPWRREVTQSSR